MSVDVYVRSGLHISVTPNSAGVTQQWVDLRYYPRDNPSGFATGVDGSLFVRKTESGQFAPSGMTGQFITTAQTGLFYPTSNPAGYITSAGGGGVSSIRITGQLLTGIVGFTGIGGTVVDVSGTVIRISGGASIGNTGQFITTAQTGQFAPSGMTGQFITTAQTGQFAPSGMTGQFITTAQTGIFYPSSNPAGYITSAQAGGVSAITVTGASLSGNVNLTGIGGLNVSLSGQYVLISGGGASNTGVLVSKGETGVFVTTFQTGQFAPSGMTGQFITTSQTGHVHSQYLTGPYGVTNLLTTGFVWSGSAVTGITYSGNVLISGGGNISVFTGATSGFQTIIVSGNTGNFVFQGNTGQFAPSGMTGQFITTAQTGVFVSRGETGSLTISGAGGISITTGISGIVIISGGDTGQFITSAQTGQFAPAGLTGQFITTAQTGHIHSQYLTGPYGLTSLLTTGFVWSGSAVTGITYSGNVLISGGGNVSVFTGATSGFQSIIISGATGNLVFQGMTGQFITTAQTGQFAPSGMTGQFITTAQTGIFYPASNPNSYITSAQAGGVSAVTVTGASVSGNVNFTGLRGINISLSGQYILVSGGDTGQFITTAQTGQYAPAGLTGQFITTSQTGQFAPSGMTGQFITTAQTGLFLTNFFKSMYLEQPTASDRISLFKSPYQLTLKRVTSVLYTTGISPSVTYSLTQSQNITGVSGVILASQIETNQSTGTLYTSFSNAIITGGNYVFFQCSGASNTNSIHLTLEF